jgi:hypothetical protein
MARKARPSAPRSAAGPAAYSATQRSLAFAVHLLTASGTGLALFAMAAVITGEFTVMFAVLGVALLVDGIDGALARRFKVAELQPRWSGEVLDLVVDFLTYVFVPAMALVMSGLLPQSLALPAAVAIVISSAIYFDRRRLLSWISRTLECGCVLSFHHPAAADRFARDGFLFRGTDIHANRGRPSVTCPSLGAPQPRFADCVGRIGLRGHRLPLAASSGGDDRLARDRSVLSGSGPFGSEAASRLTHGFRLDYQS